MLKLSKVSKIMLSHEGAWFRLGLAFLSPKLAQPITNVRLASEVLDLHQPRKQVGKKT